MRSERASLQHKPFLIPIWLTAIGAIAAFAVFCFAVVTVWVWFTASSTTIVVIRHAEKDSVSVPDPALSAAGEARAALLARMFGDAQGPGHLDAIYVSDTQRSRQTAAPLAARLRLAPIVDGGDDPKELTRRALRENAGKRVMIIGHVNTIPEIVAILSGRSDIPKVDEQDFGSMYVVTVPRVGHPNLVRLKY
jgi:phosphohistidine phosphatase SixA